MADITYRANLKTTSFPLLSELSGKSVIMKQQDQNYVPNAVPKDSVDTAMGIPQLIYCHNVMPSDSGYQSIGYQQFTSSIPGISGTIASVLKMVSSTGAIVLIANTTAGELYTLARGAGAWSKIVTGAPTAGTIAGKVMTVAFVSGTTYIYFANVGCYTYNFTTNATASQTLTGLTAANIIGICAVKGYLIAYSADAIAWSSVISATDFTPSLSTGAGGGQVEAAKGTIIVAVPVLGGMVIFTSSNAVSAISSDNPRYPFNFSEIVGAGGLSTTDYVSFDTGTGSVYAYTTSGLQSVSIKQATTVFPEITDFLSGSYVEDFNENTLTLSTSYTLNAIPKRISIIASRYLIISYGLATLSHALVYDMVYKQFGKLKTTHADCFEFQLYDQAQYETPRKSIGFIDSSGEVKVVDFDILSANSSGVMILGKFQLVRTRLLQLQGVDFENVRSDKTFNLYNYPSLDGKTMLAAIPGYEKLRASNSRLYSFHYTALNHSILAVGHFNAVSMLLNFNAAGAR